VAEPSEDDWDDAIERFRFFRHIEKAPARRRAERLPGLLETKATSLYRIADKLERTKKLDADLAAYAATAMAGWLGEEGYAEELAERFISISFLFDLPLQIAATPEALRSHAATIQNASEHAGRLNRLYTDSVEMIRDRGDTPDGDYPSVSGWWLIKRTDRWGVRYRTIAEQLVDRHVHPKTRRSEEPSGEPPTREQLVAQWIAMLRKIGPRARKRGSGTE
jgi:hypothetical protein